MPPVLNGVVASNSNKVSGLSTYTVVTNSAIGANSLIIWVCSAYGAGGTGRTWGSLTNTAGLSWTQTYIDNFLGSGANNATVFSAFSANGLSSGTTISGTFTNFQSDAQANLVFSFSQLNNDPTAIALASGTSTTPSSNSLSVPSGDLSFAVVMVNGPSGDTFTEDTDTTGGVSWVTAGTVGTTGGNAASNTTLRVGYKFPTSTASQTYNPTLGTSRFWKAMLLTFSASPEPYYGPPFSFNKSGYYG